MAALQTVERLRTDLISKLVRYWKAQGYEVRAARLPGYPPPPVSRNDLRIGDGEDKQADAYGFAPAQQVAIRGVAKVSPSDLRSPHSRTQLMLFSQMTSTESNKRSLLFIVVPTRVREPLNQVLKELNLVGKSHIIPLIVKDADN